MAIQPEKTPLTEAELESIRLSKEKKRREEMERQEKEALFDLESETESPDVYDEDLDENINQDVIEL